jgi:hypothetical protein
MPGFPMRTSIRKSRVAVLYVHPLFGQGIARLLRAVNDLEVTCLGACVAEASQHLKRLRPHAIVLEGCREDGILDEVLSGLPPALIIRVAPEDNVMDIYHRRQVISARPETLVSTIHGGLRDPIE